VYDVDDAHDEQEAIVGHSEFVLEVGEHHEDYRQGAYGGDGATKGGRPYCYGLEDFCICCGSCH